MFGSRLIQTFPLSVLVFMHAEPLSFASTPYRSNRVKALDSLPDPLLHDRLIEQIALRRDREAFAALFAYFAPRLKAFSQILLVLRDRLRAAGLRPTR